MAIPVLIDRDFSNIQLFEECGIMFKFFGNLLVILTLVILGAGFAALSHGPDPLHLLVGIDWLREHIMDG